MPITYASAVPGAADTHLDPFLPRNGVRKLIASYLISDGTPLLDSNTHPRL